MDRGGALAFLSRRQRGLGRSESRRLVKRLGPSLNLMPTAEPERSRAIGVVCLAARSHARVAGGTLAMACWGPFPSILASRNDRNSLAYIWRRRTSGFGVARGAPLASFLLRARVLGWPLFLPVQRVLPPTTKSPAHRPGGIANKISHRKQRSPIGAGSLLITVFIAHPRF